MRENMQAVRRAMQQMLPLVLVLTWLYLMQQLFLRPDGYFAVTLGYGRHIMSSFGEINRVVTLFLDKGFQIMGVLVIVLAIQKRLQDEFQGHQQTILLTLVTLVSWQMLNTTASLMNLVVLPLMVFAIMVPIQLVKPRHRYLVAILVTLLIGAYAVTLHSWLKLSLFGLLQQVLVALIGDGSTELWQTWLWVLIAVLGNWFGLNAVAGVIRPDISATAANENLVAALQHQTIPHVFSLYPLSAFVWFGGAGLMLALLITYLIQARNKPLPVLLILTIIPTFFDQWWALAFALPIMWNWRVLKTMLIASTVNLGIGALLLALHLAPAVYWVPSGTPTILFGGLASHNMLLYVLVMIGLLALDVVIFWRVVQELHKSGEVAYA